MSRSITIQGSEIAFLQVKKAALVLRILSNPLCQRILQLLEDETELTVSEIYSKLSIEQCTASSYLSKLKRNDIVNTRKKGKYIYYCLNVQKLIILGHALSEIIPQSFSP